MGGGSGAPPRPAAALSVVLPTYNEAENLPDVMAHLERSLRGLAYEIIVVWGSA